jgi:hypothetical protein
VYRRDRDRRRLAVLVATILLALSLTVVAACPPCLLRSDAMLAGMARSHRALVEQDLFAIDPALGWYARPYLYQAVASLPFSLGWPLYGLCLYGLVVAVRRRTLADRIVLAAIVPYLVFFAGSGAWMPRYLMPVLPWLAVLAARGLADLSSTHRRGATGLFAASWAYSLVYAVSLVVAEGSHPQAEVARWIASHPSAGVAGQRPVRVGFPVKSGAVLRLGPPLQRAGLVTALAGDGDWLAPAPDVFVLPTFDEVWIARGRKNQARASLRRLQQGDSGYDEVARWTPWYLQRSFYTWLDPAFGSNGFAVYVRRDAG